MNLYECFSVRFVQIWPAVKVTLNRQTGYILNPGVQVYLYRLQQFCVVVENGVVRTKLLSSLPSGCNRSLGETVRECCG